MVIIRDDPKDKHCKKHHILKHIIFQKDMKNRNKNRVHVEAVASYCHGMPMIMDLGNKNGNGSLALQYMLEKLVGYQPRYFIVQQRAETKGKALTTDMCKAGYEFIRNRGPKSNNKSQFMEWAVEHCNAEAYKDVQDEKPCPV